MIRFASIFLVYFFLSNTYGKTVNVDTLCHKYNKWGVESTTPIEVYELDTGSCRFNIYCFEDKFYSAKLSLVCKKNEFYDSQKVKKEDHTFTNSSSVNDESLIISAVHINQLTGKLSGTLFKVKPNTVDVTVLSSTKSGIIHIIEENGSDRAYLMEETSCKESDLKLFTIKKCFRKIKPVSLDSNIKKIK